MILEMKNNRLVKVILFILLFLILKELVYLLIGDFYLVRFRLHTLNHGFFVSIYVLVFVVVQLFSCYVTYYLLKNLNNIVSILVFFAVIIISFYVNSLIYSNFSEEYSFEFIKYFFISWSAVSIVFNFFMQKTIMRISNKKNNHTNPNSTDLE